MVYIKAKIEETQLKLHFIEVLFQNNRIMYKCSILIKF